MAETVRPPPTSVQLDANVQLDGVQPDGNIPSQTGIRLTADRTSAPPPAPDVERRQRTTLPEPLLPIALEEEPIDEDGATNHDLPLALHQPSSERPSAAADSDRPSRSKLDVGIAKALRLRTRSVTIEVAQKRQLGRYELAFELASGGFAVVYLARVLGPGGFEKYVALKKIHSHLAQEKEFVEMFLDEARIAACINHPNVCPVFDFGEADGAYFLAMDYVFGEPFSVVMRALRKLDAANWQATHYPLIARIVAEAAEGLHAAHEAIGPDGKPLQVVHRDVAPPNFFIRYDGHVQVVDFGIASAVGKLHMTASGVMKGHLSYVSPEQFSGGIVDRRSDIWGLGVIFWELLTGQRLYRRETDVKTMFAVLSEPLAPLRDVMPDIPEVLEVVVRKALAKNPSERFQTAREMSQALQTYLHSGHAVVGPHEVAQWLQELLPGAKQEKGRILDEARVQLEAKHTGLVLPLARLETELGAEGTESASSADAPSILPPATLAPKPASQRWWLIAGATTAIAGAIAWWIAIN